MRLKKEVMDLEGGGSPRGSATIEAQKDVMNLEPPGPLPQLSREAFPIALAPLATIAGP